MVRCNPLPARAGSCPSPSCSVWFSSFAFSKANSVETWRGVFGKSPPLLIKAASWHRASGILFLPNTAAEGWWGIPEICDTYNPVSERWVYLPAAPTGCRVAMAMPEALPPAEGTDAAHDGITCAQWGAARALCTHQCCARLAVRATEWSQRHWPSGTRQLQCARPPPSFKGLGRDLAAFSTWALHCFCLTPVMVLTRYWYLPPACRIRAVETSPRCASIGSVKPTHCCFWTKPLYFPASPPTCNHKTCSCPKLFL